MKLVTTIRISFVIALLFSSQITSAQEILSHPDQYVAIGAGSARLNGTISSQTKKETAIAAEQTAMIAMLEQIKRWQRSYNSYLQNAEGYASAVKAGSSLYGHGILLLENIVMLKNVASNSHGAEGLISTGAMSELYGQTAAQMIKTYRILRFTIAKGTKKNMLTGSQRTELLWMLDDELAKLNKMLREASIMVASYNLTDVFKKYVACKLPKNKNQLGRECLKSWRNAGKATQHLIR